MASRWLAHSLRLSTKAENTSVSVEYRMSRSSSLGGSGSPAGGSVAWPALGGGTSVARTVVR